MTSTVIHIEYICFIIPGIVFLVNTYGQLSRIEENGMPEIGRSSSRECTFHIETHLLNCSFRDLSCIPNGVPSNTEILQLSHNSIARLKTNDFKLMSSLKQLNLSFNVLSILEGGSLNGLAKLRTLDLSFNIISQIQLPFLSSVMSLQQLNFTSNSLYSFISENVTHPHLQTLILSRNRLGFFPNCTHKDGNMFPKLESLDLQGNSINVFTRDDFRGLAALEQLNLGRNQIKTIKTDCFRFAENLKSLKLDYNDLSSVDVNAFISNSLENLTLAKSKFCLNLTSSKTITFQKLPNLRLLNLGSCTFTTSLRSEAYSYLLSQQHHLEFLNLYMTRLNKTKLFYLIGRLTNVKHLAISDNTFDNLERATFETISKSLESLFMSKIRISTINQTSLPTILWTKLKEIDLTANPWNCDCGLVWFRKWLRTTNVTVKGYRKNPHEYECSAPTPYDKTPLSRMFHPTEIECFSSSADWCLDIVAGAISTVYSLILICAVIHRLRWHIRYWLFLYQVSYESLIIVLYTIHCVHFLVYVTDVCTIVFCIKFKKMQLAAYVEY